MKMKMRRSFILVRHAEKKAEGRNPELTEAGKQRATKLIKLLQNTQLDEVFSTNYLRTVMTAEPIAQLKKLGVEIYDPSNLQQFAERLKTNYKGKRILVSGHSNTTPTLVNLLLENEVYQQIDEKDYGNFFHRKFERRKGTESVEDEVLRGS